MTLWGIDVSNHQKGMNLKKHLPGFVLIKATDGSRFVDPACDPFVQQCKQDNLRWGFYHFANSPQKSSMRAQARYFVKHCRNYFGNGLPCLDWEDSRYGGQVIRHGPRQAKIWLDEVYRLTGIRPLIYMSASVTTRYDWSAVVRNYPLWGAGYPGGATYSNPGTNRYRWGAWGKPLIHQYTSRGGLDKNIGYLSGSDWDNLVGGKKLKPNKKSNVTVTPVRGAYEKARRAKQIMGPYPEWSPVLHVLERHIGRPGAVKVLAQDVLAGKFGNGKTREKNLGPYYQEVQDEVNKLCK